MGNKVSARERVRQARSRRDAERKAQEKRVDGCAEDFFKAAARLEQAQQAVEEARRAQGAAIESLLAEGETLASLTEFLDVPKADLKSAQQAHQQRPVRVSESDTPSGGGSLDRGRAGDAA